MSSDISPDMANLLSILDNVPASVYVSDMKTHEIIFINKQLRDVFGDIEGQTCWKSLQSGQSGPCDFCTNDRLLDESGNPSGTYTWEFKNTINNRWYELQDKAIPWSDGRYVRMEIATDITEHKRLEEGFSILRNAVDKSRECIFLIDSAANITKVNNTACNALGYTKEELQSMSVPDIDPHFPESRWKEHWEELKEKGSMTFESAHRNKDGIEYPVEIAIDHVMFGDKEYSFARARNIAKQKLQDTLINKIADNVTTEIGETFFRSMVKFLSEALDVEYALVGELCSYEKETVKTLSVYASGQYIDNFEYKLAGTPCEKVVGKDLCSFSSKVQVKFPDDHLLKQMNVESYVGIPLFDSNKNATGIVVVMDTKPLVDEQVIKSLFRIFSGRAASEIDRMQTEQKLKESEVRYRTFLDSSSDIFALKDSEFRHLMVNRACTEFMGRSKDEILGKTDFELLPFTVAELCHKTDREAMNTGDLIVNEEIIGNKTYETRTFRVSLGADKFGIGVYARDITNRKNTEKELHQYRSHLERLVEDRTVELSKSNTLLRAEVNERKIAERALRKSEEKYHSIFETAANLITSVDNKGIIVDCNKRAKIVLGYDPEELIGQSMAKIIHPEYMEKATGSLEFLFLQGFLFNSEYKMVRKDGTNINVNINSSALRNYKGQHYRTICIIEDITERKNLEKSLMETEERERQLLGHDLHDSLGQLLTGIAFKMRGLGRNLEKRNLSEAEDAADISVLVDKAKEQVTLLLKGLSPVEPEGEGLSSALEILASYVRGTYGINCIFIGDGAVSVTSKAAVTQAYRIAQEAVTNATKHAAPSAIEISLVKSNGNIELSVKDNGSGIDKDSLDNEGMGLRIMKHRADIIHGTLDINSSSDGTHITCSFQDNHDHEKD